MNAWGKNSPQFDIIQKKLPRLASAVQHGCKISENIQIVKAILNKLDEDEHCPCRLIKNEDTKCICKEFRDAIEAGKPGKCHCGLYELIDSEG